MARPNAIAAWWSTASPGVDVALPVAGPGARSFAFLIDWHIRAMLAVAWYVVAALIHNGRWSRDRTPESRLRSGSCSSGTRRPRFISSITRPGKSRRADARPANAWRAYRSSAATAGHPASEPCSRATCSASSTAFRLLYAVGLVTTMVTRNHVRIGQISLARHPAGLPPPATPTLAELHKKSFYAAGTRWMRTARRPDRQNDPCRYGRRRRRHTPQATRRSLTITGGQPP